MAEPEAMKPMTDRRAVHRDRVNLFQFHPQFIQRQIAALRQALAQPPAQAVQLAGAPQVALTLGRKPARLTAQLDHVIDELR